MAQTYFYSSSFLETPLFTPVNIVAKISCNAKKLVNTISFQKVIVIKTLKRNILS